MKKWISLLLCYCLICNLAYSQQDSLKLTSGIFERIASGIKEYKLDTSDAPNDRITKKINDLRKHKGGFNINEAVQFKIEEDRQKKEVPKEELDKISYFFTQGNGKRWLDNAVTWIYRNHFTHKELKQLVKFYKTSAGQKMANDFPLIMMKSMRAAELIKEMYDGK